MVDAETLAQDIARDGAFSTLRRYVREGKITRDEASAYMSQIFSRYREKLTEVKKEIERLSAVAQRLDPIIQRGCMRRPFLEEDPQVRALAHELVALDGWVMSLYESDLTMIWWGLPERGRAKASEMAHAMDQLYQKRVDAMKFGLKDPSLFRLA